MEVDDILKDFDRDVQGQRTQKYDIYQQLTQATLNERMAPEVLPYEHELLTQVLNQLTEQQQFLLESHEYGDANMETGIIQSDFKLQLMIIETDIERLNYLVRLYLRIRLSKIDKFTIHYVNLTSQEEKEVPGKKSLLSEEEIDYMHKHFKLLTNLYNNSFLKHMPDYLTLLDDSGGGQQMVVTPDIDQPVFIKVNSKEVITVSLDEEDDLDLEEGGIYVVKFSLIRKYLEIGDVSLI